MYQHLQRSVRVRQKTGRKRVTVIEKPNVLRETGGLMMDCFGRWRRIIRIFGPTK